MPNIVPQAEPITALTTMEHMSEIALEILSEVNESRDEALDSYRVFKNLLTNEGEGSSATKEQIGALLHIALEATDKKIKLLNIMAQYAKRSGDKVNATQNNNYYMDRRAMIDSIESVINGEEITDDDE